MHAVQNSLANGLVDAIGGGPQSRYLFALWLALLMMFLFGFIFLLVVNINQWTGAGQTDGVILNDGGNTDSPVGHCNPETSEPQPGGVITCCGTPAGVSTCTRRASATSSSPRAALTSCGRWKVPGTWMLTAATAQAFGMRGRWYRSSPGQI